MAKLPQKRPTSREVLDARSAHGSAGRYAIPLRMFTDKGTWQVLHGAIEGFLDVPGKRQSHLAVQKL